MQVKGFDFITQTASQSRIRKEKREQTLSWTWLPKGIVLIGVPVWLFYRSIFCVLLGLLLLPLYRRLQKKEHEKEQQRRLNRGFADALAAFSASLEAGYSAENAVNESLRDLEMFYAPQEPIRKEFRHLQLQLRNNRSLESALSDMAERTQDEDILCFSQVFTIAKRSGGDLIQVIKATERNIAERAEVKREIQTVLSAKQLEANIMNLMPCGIILYFQLCDPIYLMPVYEGVAGRLVMTVLLLLYLACVLWSGRLTQIEV